ncbi:MAG TPA: hypothetical protein VNW92_00160 [Polyangiaceae bacterium]|nr:hypothetical protein [Polyangiaceae bacterium]
MMNLLALASQAECQSDASPSEAVFRHFSAGERWPMPAFEQRREMLRESGALKSALPPTT